LLVIYQLATTSSQRSEYEYRYAQKSSVKTGSEDLCLWCLLNHMVNQMEETVRVDKQGRLVIPPRIREFLGLKDGGSILIRVDGSRVVLEPAFHDLGESVDEWKEATLKLKSEAFTEKTEESWKWMSREYARRKLGL